MSDLAIRVRDLGKKYHIGGARKEFRTLGEKIKYSFLTPLRRARALLGGHATGAADLSEELWALRDVSFDVEVGEVVGIIGRNGAGKTTLLKILSRITEPSAGYVEVAGRVASLLEVGTGFHPELTGRENIYLNGAILGMTKREIEEKFDDIVDFSGVERFMETPVKHYSSGMYVRLAFAVAAHLEPEILLVDEVLSVGDAAFQKKCLGKMDDVAGEGRTVLFVSHNMPMLESLCQRAILLEDGTPVKDGPAGAVIREYLAGVYELAATPLAEREDRRGTGDVRVTDVEILDGSGRPVKHASSGRDLIVRVHFSAAGGRTFGPANASVVVTKEERVFFSLSTTFVDERELTLSGDGHIDFIVPELPLTGGDYILHTYLGVPQTTLDYVESAAALSVVDGDFFGTGRLYLPGHQGKTVLVKHDWQLGQSELRPTAAGSGIGA